MATFEKWGSTYPVYESTDDAKSWHYVSTVIDNLNDGYRNEWMSFLYELPADIGDSDTGTDMFISFDYGKTFAPVDNPIPYTLDPYDRCGYSPSLFFSSDGATLYYVNNPPCYDSTYKITVAKISISER